MELLYKLYLKWAKIYLIKCYEMYIGNDITPRHVKKKSGIMFAWDRPGLPQYVSIYIFALIISLTLVFLTDHFFTLWGNY